MTLWELTIGHAYLYEGDVGPLVDYLRSGETKDDAIAKEFIARVLLGELKRGDRRRGRTKARDLEAAFQVRRLVADAEEREGAPRVTDDDIHATLAANPDTAKRMIKRHRASRKV